MLLVPMNGLLMLPSDVQQTLVASAVGAFTALLVFLLLDAIKARKSQAATARALQAAILDEPGLLKSQRVQRRSRESSLYGAGAPSPAMLTSGDSFCSDAGDEPSPKLGIARQYSSDASFREELPEMHIDRHTEDASLRLP